MAILAAREGAQLLSQRFTGERAGGQHGDLIGCRQLGLFAALHRHQGMGLQTGGEGGAIAAPIHSQGATGGHRMGIGGGNHQRTQPPQFLLQ